MNKTKKTWFLTATALIIPIAAGGIYYCLSSSGDQLQEEQIIISRNPNTTVHEDQKIKTTDNYGGSQLEKTSQKIRQNDWGTYTLIKDIPINKTYHVEPMAIIIKSLRILALSDMTEDTKELLASFTGLSFKEAMNIYHNDHLNMEEIGEKMEYSQSDIQDGITFLELNYTAKNTSSKKIQFFSFEQMDFSNKLSYNVPERNFILLDDTFMGSKSVSRIDYQANETGQGTIGLLNDRGKDLKSLSSFTFSTSEVIDGDSHAQIGTAKTFTVHFKQ